MKNQPPKITIKFEPDSGFDQEFLEFIEMVLSWRKKEKQQVNNPPREKALYLNINKHKGEKINNRTFI